MKTTLGSSPQPQPANRVPVRALRGALAATAALVAIGFAASITPAQSAKPKPHAAASTLIVSRPTEIHACTGCHGANLKGRKGFSPGLTRSGVLKEYNVKTWERVMDTGVTNDGGMVHKPMPAFHYSAAVSDKLYNYLKTLQ